MRVFKVGNVKLLIKFTWVKGDDDDGKWNKWVRILEKGKGIVNNVKRNELKRVVKSWWEKVAVE